MPRSALKSLVLSSALGVLAIGASASGASAGGLFDFLFGSSRETPSYDAPVMPRSDITVGLRRRPVARQSTPRVRSASKASAKKVALQVAIDPVARPNWYLEDPTLRRGDIVVLKTGAMVFNGDAAGGIGTEDFTNLSRSTLVSKADKAMLEKSVRAGTNDQIVSVVVPAKRVDTVALQTP